MEMESPSADACAPRYLLVTPAKNEEAVIGRTIAAVIGQTVHPAEWVIVSDGSTDGTDALVEEAARDHPWIRLIRLDAGHTRCFAAVVRNTMLGIRSATIRDHTHLGLIDADIEMAPDYFETLLDRFARDPLLGLAGGLVVDPGMPVKPPSNLHDVPGAVQLFRRLCFDRMGGLTPVAEGGWDAVSCVQARMAGFRTRLFPDLVVRHLKPRNVSQGGAIRRKWQLGVRDQALGYHPLFEAVKCTSRIGESPAILGAVARWIGFCQASLMRRKRTLEPDVVNHLRSEQLARLRTITNFRRPQPVPP
jgi:glycosyltransferase involved in cell wall biosynthesis